MTASTEEKKIVLYNAPTSPFGHRVLMAFKEAGVEYKVVSVDMANREWVKEIYPEAKVPFIKYGDNIIPESMVILELIQDLYPTVKLYPKDDPIKKAKMKFIILLFEDRLRPLTRKFLSNPITRETFDVYVEEMTKIYRRLNDLLLEQDPSGPYYLGIEYSAVDIALAPFVFQVTHFVTFLTGHDYRVLDKLPRLRVFFASILDHPTFKETAYLTDEMLDTIVADRFKVERNMFAK